jgi:Methyltransferase domain
LPSGTWVRAKLLLSRFLRNKRLRARCYPLAGELIKDRYGIEIGGPSGVFRGKYGVLPLYPLVGRLDNCNYASRTTWEGAVAEGATFLFDNGKPRGQQWVAEATDLSRLTSAQYDFVLSSHTLEHSANTLKVLGELMRILKDEGALVLLLPHGEGTFDHRRPATTLAHLVGDLRADTGEDDMTHFDEIIAFHDLSRDPEAGTMEQFEARSRKNPENRCFHQHVFDTQLVIDVLDYVGVQMLAVETMAPHHIIAVARKMPAGLRPNNTAYLSGDAAWRRVSVFSRDRTGRAAT